MNINFETSNKIFSDIIGNGKKYSVPKYQRDYSWNVEQLEDLWQDLWDMYQSQEKEEHYMGYLVLQKKGQKEFTIIDGQQRIATLSLLILSAMQIFKNSDNPDDKERLQLYENSFIRYKEASSLTHRYKLTLNRNNDFYFKNEMCTLVEKPKSRNIKASEQLLRKAKEFLYKKIVESKLSGGKLGRFLDTTANYLLFTVITVGDDVNAYKVFETLNARGVKLSTPDLLKNYIFSIADKNEEGEKIINNLEEKWTKILGDLAKSDFTKFVRTHWNSYNRISTKTKLFKTIKNTIQTPQNAIDYLELLYQDVEVYVALQKYDDDFWAEYNEVVKECLFALQTFNIVQPMGVLLAAFKQYEKRNFEKVCKWILAISIRYNAIGNLPPNQQDQLYNEVAQKINNREAIGYIKEILKRVYTKDEDFLKSFSIKKIPTTQSSKKAVYLLSAIENFMNKNNPINFLTSSNPYTLEHILPKKEPADDSYWRDQFDDLLEQNIDKLGNLTLLTKKQNEKIGNENFLNKKKIFKNSQLSIVKKMTEYEDWNVGSIDDYQKWLSEKACQKWRID